VSCASHSSRHMALHPAWKDTSSAAVHRARPPSSKRNAKRITFLKSIVCVLSIMSAGGSRQKSVFKQVRSAGGAVDGRPTQKGRPSLDDARRPRCRRAWHGPGLSTRAVQVFAKEAPFHQAGRPHEPWRFVGFRSSVRRRAVLKDSGMLTPVIA